uniref:Uncharacterized protein n=1 Tax=Magallana gigas TaxID=29159 RepID=K1QFZ3_MAGGI
MTMRDLASSDSDSYGTSDPSGSEPGSDLDENGAEESAAKMKAPRKKKMMAIEFLVAVMCCAAMCLGGISQELMVASRENVQSLSNTERKQWLLDYFWSHSK